MNASLGQTLARAQGRERKTALQALLESPLLSEHQDPENYALVLRHQAWLVEWFERNTGWRLGIRRRARLARLRKKPSRTDAHRGARGHRDLFDQRRYVLLCLLLAGLDDAAGQSTLSSLADYVRSASAEDEVIADFKPELRSERRALVDALRWLENMGILRLRDGQVEGYADQENADVLYDVNDDLLGQIISCDLPPSLAKGPEEILSEAYADSADGRRLRARHQVMRRLIDDPVCYFEDLDEEERAWLEHSWGWLKESFETQIGLPIERRKEGLAAIDMEGTLSDLRFPDGASTVKHAALLLCERLADQSAQGARLLPLPLICDWMHDMQEDMGKRCNWSKAYPTDRSGAESLARDALDLLAGFDLLRYDDDSVRAMPAVARFRPGSTGS